MNSLAAYSGSSSEDEGPTKAVRQEIIKDLASKKKRLKLELAPVVASRDTTLSVKRMIDPQAKVLSYNPKVEELYGAEMGPQNPFKTRQEAALKNTIVGFVEGTNLSDYNFEEQRRTFSNHGYAFDPAEANSVVGDVDLAKKNSNATISDNSIKKKKTRKRAAYGDAGDLENFQGTWGRYKDEKTTAKPTDEEQAILDQYKENSAIKAASGGSGKKKEMVEKAVLHIADAEDYQGKSFLDIPQGVGSTRLDSVDYVPDRCFLPKKHIHSWNGHTKGISVVRLFPVSGHLLLSAGMDGKVILWEFYGKRRRIQTYHGHSEAVLDIAFNNDGSKFLSCSFDKYVKLWDTKTGECLNKFTTGKVPRCVAFNPAPDKQHMFIAGCKDKKIIQWDINTGEIIQEYDRHLGGVNSVTFTEEGTRFVSTSDDNSIRIWEWEIPVDFKYIAEPTQHSMPRVSIHPHGKWMCTQSMDNQIFVFGASGRYRQHKKKRFTGHLSAGYACEINFSPDGKYVISGDYEGRLIFWDWKTGKLYKKMDAHSEVCIGCIWHPHEPSKIITCSWDGTIKLWD